MATVRRRFTRASPRVRPAHGSRLPVTSPILMLARLYGRASVFAFPSLDEGFGIPVLEAMAHGIPVLSSNRSALPEACGDAALLVDPLDVEAITKVAPPDRGSELRDRLIWPGSRVRPNSPGSARSTARGPFTMRLTGRLPTNGRLRRLQSSGLLRNF